MGINIGIFYNITDIFDIRLFTTCNHNRKTKKNKLRRCRAGAGVEDKPNSGITPGFATRTNDNIVNDFRGFK